MEKAPAAPAIERSRANPQRSNGGHADAQLLLGLQRSAGNRAVGALLRRYEQRQPSPQPGRPGVVQRKWLDTGSPEHKWDQLAKGLQWFRTRDQDSFYYQVRKETDFLGVYDKDLLAKAAADQGKVKTRAEWVRFFGGNEDAVPESDAAVEVQPTPPTGATAPATLDQIMDPYLSTMPVGDVDGFKLEVGPLVDKLSTGHHVDVAAVVRTVANLQVKRKADNKMYCVENVLAGLVTGLDGGAPYIQYIVKSLEAPTDKSRQIADAVAYATVKGRWDATTFETVFKGVVFDIKRTYPRGFSSEQQWREFAADYRGLLGRYGSQLFVQGSAAIDIGGSVKDIDIAVLVNAAEFDNALAVHCTDKSKVLWKVLVNLGRKAGNWDKNQIDSADITAALQKSRHPAQPPPLTLNSSRESIEYSYARGFWKNSDFLTKPEKKTRDDLDKKWKAALNLAQNMDMSIIKRGGDFDKPPYLPLP